MFQITIDGTPVLFSKFFAPEKGQVSDREKVLAAIRATGAQGVVFIDTPATTELVTTISTLKDEGMEVYVRDHHDAPGRGNPREVAIADAAERIRSMIGNKAIISDRKTHPSCSSLIGVNEFLKTGLAVVADSDPDGLLGAMKAAGIVYEGMDADADVLDGGRAGQTADRLTPNAWLLARAMATLPPFDAARPQVSEDAKAKLFADFVAVVQGDPEARGRLEKGVEVYEAGVAEAQCLATTVTDALPGVPFVDLTAAGRFDLGTLAAAMEARPGAKVTVQRKSAGPIAAKHGGVQISLAVAKNHQVSEKNPGGINLQELLPPGFTSSPEAGIISNTTFLLHVSENVWNETVLPALRALFEKS